MTDYKRPVTSTPGDWDGQIIRTVAFHSKVLVVARTRKEGAWAAYCAPVEGDSHKDSIPEVLAYGSKLYEPWARALFPEFNDLPYAA